MKKFTLTILIFVLTAGIIYAKKVEESKAKLVAETFLSQSKHYNGNSSVSLAEVFEFESVSIINPNVIEKTPLLYVFDIANENGIILVSGDDVASPILGYTTSGNFDKEKLPYSFQKWIEGYKRQIQYAIDNELEAISDVEITWKKLIAGEQINTDGSAKAVSPLCTTTWDQAPYYNAMCPGGSVTGCVATAMAQVMKFWNHPAQGTGMHSYNHNEYGTLSANFGATTYQWSQMPNSINSNNDAIATLMYHCGVSVDMGYSPQVSGAWVVEDDSPVCSESAFKNYFGYNPSLHGEKRDNYSTSQWLQMVYADLDAGRPLVYAGFGSGGGHAFVCDGYDANDYFHFNWGWGGYYDGFFHIDALDPGGTGTGGGTGGYNSGHQAIFEMIPETTSTSYDLKLYENLQVNPSTIGIGDAFTVNSVIGNYGNDNFNGDFAAFIFDANMNAIDYVEILSGQLDAGYFNTYSFSTSGMSSLLPGSYYISIYYRTSGGNWMEVGDGNYYNSIPFTVENESDIELYSAFYLTTGTTITQNDPFSVFVDIVNYGGSTFYGAFDISIYDLDGYWVESIQTLTGAALESGYFYDDLEFSTSGITATPGTYLLALQHQPTNGEWTLSGSSSYPNPIQVIIKAAGELPDIYEPNDAENSATNLNVDFVGNNASVYTTGSNSDNGFDYDYYYLNLPSGYDYTIDARAHDAYNSGNGQTYTNDILWSYNTGAFWSLAYDDVMFGNIQVNNGGMVKFLAAPYFPGETGTYLLEFQVSRTPIGIDDVFSDNSISLYPNPVNEELNIEISNDLDISSIKVRSITGSLVNQVKINENQSSKIIIDMSKVDAGTYVVTAASENKVWHKKIVKTK